MSAFAERCEARLSRDGRRLRLIHGPIDAIVTADGPEPARMAAFERLRTGFTPLLGDLVTELARLRAATGPAPRGAVARAMVAATAPFAPLFITPMAAVAGSVADHLLAAALVPGHGLARLHVNNGGDIALWSRADPFRVAICDDPMTGRSGGRIEVPADAGIGGIATSGWRGRSFSMGIADAVTVLADTAAQADAAATLIANAVDLPGHPEILRARACELVPESDLGDRAVVIDVGPLSEAECAEALAPALALAQNFRQRGLIRAAYLALGDARATLADTHLQDTCLPKEPALA